MKLGSSRVGVYCRSNSNKRLLLGNELEQIKNTWGNRGTVGGNFNTILHRSERLGNNSNDSEMEKFKSIID